MAEKLRSYNQQVCFHLLTLIRFEGVAPREELEWSSAVEPRGSPPPDNKSPSCPGGSPRALTVVAHPARLQQLHVHRHFLYPPPAWGPERARPAGGTGRGSDSKLRLFVSNSVRHLSARVPQLHHLRGGSSGSIIPETASPSSGGAPEANPDQERGDTGGSSGSVSAAFDRAPETCVGQLSQ